MHRYRLAWYGFTIFLSSSILMVLEITAGRLIAPYVGVSIYSWTSIIGVILSGLSLGNWLGGRWADRGANEWHTAWVLGLAAVFSLFSLLALSLIAPSLQQSQLDLVSSSFLYVMSMFFIPSVLLGIPTPLLTTLALGLDQRAGHIVGRMHALAALGSILGTFLTGFVFIQYFGSRNIIVASAAVLFALSIPFFYRRSKAVPAVVILCALILSLGIYQRQGFTNPCDRESNYFCLRVVDSSNKAPFGSAKALVLDHLIHGINHESEPALLIAPYVHLMDELVRIQFGQEFNNGLNYFFAGGGSYTHPRAILAEVPKSKIVVAEIDKAVTEIVSQEMYLSTKGIEIYHQDARTTLHRLQNQRFDVVVTDAFHDIAIPYHLVTREYAQLVKSRMKPKALFVTNVVDAFPDPKMVKSMLKTLQQEFKYVYVWLDQLPQTPMRLTYVLSASDQDLQQEFLNSQRGLKRQWYRINQPMLTVGTPLSELPVFTDDYVPVERMISKLLLTSEGL